ncbi:MAG: hypothetical protein IAE94_06875 [Chthoniobacterales bacterium]|nr:hypothetical protein [Chthoniobacterales bacterium]
MKNGQIFAHKSTARGRLDLEYLDETSGRKLGLRERADLDQQIGKRLKHFTEYASKESLGQVHAGGFLHDHIRVNPDGTSTAPARLSNAERKRRITDSWQVHLARFPSNAKRPVIAHRLIFSMSTEQHDALVSAGINPDQVLHSTMKKVMRKFAEKFHPGDSIGYAYGLHHDTAHLHAHVALCPRTAKGKYVGCSTSRFSRARHKRQMDVIKTWFEKENQRWERILSSPQGIEQAVSQRIDSDKLVFSPQLNRFQLEALRQTQTAEAIRLQQSYQSIRNLEAAIAAKRRFLAVQRDANFVSRLAGRRKPKFVRTVEKLAAVVDRRSLREMQSLLFKITRGYRAAHKRYSQTYGFNAYANRSTIAHSHRQQGHKLGVHHL